MLDSMAQQEEHANSVLLLDTAQHINYSQSATLAQDLLRLEQKYLLKLLFQQYTFQQKIFYLRRRQMPDSACQARCTSTDGDGVICGTSTSAHPGFKSSRFSGLGTAKCTGLLFLSIPIFYTGSHDASMLAQSLFFSANSSVKYACKPDKPKLR